MQILERELAAKDTEVNLILLLMYSHELNWSPPCLIK